MPELISARSDGRETVAFAAVGVVFLILIPLLNVLPAEESWWHVSDFRLNQFGKFLAFAILALGLDLIWGYCGVLSLGQGVFFGFGAYCMGMYLSLQIGTESVYGSELPDFMVWTQVKELPLFWYPFKSFVGLPRGDAGADAGGDDLWVSRVPEPHQRGVLRHHHAGPGFCGLVGLQSQRDAVGRDQWLDRF